MEPQSEPQAQSPPSEPPALPPLLPILLISPPPQTCLVDTAVLFGLDLASGLSLPPEDIWIRSQGTVSDGYEIIFAVFHSPEINTAWEYLQSTVLNTADSSLETGLTLVSRFFELCLTQCARSVQSVELTSR